MPFILRPLSMESIHLKHNSFILKHPIINMKLFLDSAQIEEIETAMNFGLIDGITTNPSLLKKAAQSHEGMDLELYLKKILKIMKDKPVSLEVKCCSAKDMYDQAMHLWNTFKTKDNNVIIKIPINPTTNSAAPINFEGFRVIKKLADQGIPVNTTLIFTPEQALLAAKAGSKYVSPFCGRIDDKIRQDHNITFGKKDYFPSYGWNEGGNIIQDEGIISGVDLVEQIKTIFKNFDIKSEIIAASMRNARQVREVALVGSDIATASFSTIEELTTHPKTIEGMVSFVHDTVPEYDKILGIK